MMVRGSNTEEVSTMQFYTIFLATLLFSLSNLASAAELTRFTFDGKEIILFDDKTWEFADNTPATAAPDCEVVNSEKLPISICLNPEIWTFATLSGDHEVAVKVKDRELYLLMITEKQFIETGAFKKAIIANAQNVSGLTKVQTLAEESVVLDLYNFGRLVYTTKVDGLPVTFDNYYSNIKDKGSFQFVFFAGRDDFESHKQTIADAVGGIKVTR